ncbi:MAG: hypothetical protein ACFFC6_14600 [Promethearchaeota archaeon]
MATVSQDPYFDIFDFYDSIFIRSVPLEDPTLYSIYALFGILILLVLGPLLIILLPIFWYLKQQKINIA